MNKTTLPLIAGYFNPVLLFHSLFTAGVFPNYVGILVVLIQHGTSSTAM
jgi:hypothetical protein